MFALSSASMSVKGLYIADLDIVGCRESARRSGSFAHSSGRVLSKGLSKEVLLALLLRLSSSTDRAGRDDELWVFDAGNDPSENGFEGILSASDAGRSVSDLETSAGLD